MIHTKAFLKDQQYENPPPSALEVEKTVLNTLMRGDESDRKLLIDALQPDHFYATVHKILFAKIVELNRQGKEIDLSLIYANFSTRDHKHVSGSQNSSLCDEPPAVDIVGAIATLKGRSARRHAIELAYAVDKAAYD